MAYYRIEPFGEERADVRAGLICSTVANAIARPKDPFKVSDFMPYAEREAQTVDAGRLAKDLKASLKSLAKPKRK